jgi:predicted dehydrogenase
VSESVKNINVGLLAYGAIGDEHSRAISTVDGLRLTAVADTNPDRLEAAKVLAHWKTSIHFVALSQHFAAR